MPQSPFARPLPRAYRIGGRETTLEKALREGANPYDLEVEDGVGGWRPYLEPRPLRPAGNE